MQDLQRVLRGDEFEQRVRYVVCRYAQSGEQGAEEEDVVQGAGVEFRHGVADGEVREAAADGLQRGEERGGVDLRAVLDAEVGEGGGAVDEVVEEEIIVYAAC